MKPFLVKNKYFFFLILIFIAAEFIVNPIGEFPLNDDWSYSKSVLIYHNEGKYEIGDFGAMTLFTHLGWGILFTKIFGFSFTALRFSTLISSFIGLAILNKLVVNINSSKPLGFISALILLFNPMYFNLTNTYMTDVNFNTLCLLSCYLAYSFFQTKHIQTLIFFFLTTIFLTLLRQFGLIAPISFFIACFFIKEKKWCYVSIAAVGVLVVIFCLKSYEKNLSEILTLGSSYKFSGKINLFTESFWTNLIANTKERFSTTLLQIVFYCFPIALLYLPSLIKEFKISTLILAFIFNSTLAFLLFKEEPFPYKNIFSNMCLGPETFYESSQTYISHTYSETFKDLMKPLKFGFSFVTFFVASLTLVKLAKLKKQRLFFKPEILFLMCLFVTYMVMIFMTESYFDRYTIPLITISLIFLAYVNKKFEANLWNALAPLLLLFYISFAGTKDYFTLNKKKWEAFNYLKNEKKIESHLINAGFEVNCWNGGQKTWWTNFMGLEGYDYLIQFKSEDGFKLYKEYEFQRYFPYRKDKINIFVRTSEK